MSKFKHRHIKQLEPWEFYLFKDRGMAKELQKMAIEQQCRGMEILLGVMYSELDKIDGECTMPIKEIKLIRAFLNRFRTQVVDQAYKSSTDPNKKRRHHMMK